jgi:hypothetical protein
MKHIKKYRMFESTKSIDDICKEYGIQNYTINPDGIVDVDGDVSLSNKGLDKIPVKFGKVTGTFGCDDNQLTSLEGCPTETGGDFWCYNNQLTSLEGCPTEVSGSFGCSNNQLTSLEGCPKIVGGNFLCGNNQLTSLEGCPKSINGNFLFPNNLLTTLEGCPTEVGGDFWCYYNKLTTLEGLSDVFIGARFIYRGNPIYKVTNSWLIDIKSPDTGLIELFNDVGVIVGNKLYLSKLEYFHDGIGVDLPDLEEVKKYYEIIE